MSFSKKFLSVSLLSVGLLINSSAFAKVKVGQVFPDFTLKKFADPNSSVKLSSLKGKVVIVDFWASWCEPCKVELPILNKINKKFQGKGLEIIGVNEDKELAEANTFLKEFPVQMTLLADGQKAEVLNKLEVAGLPVTYVLDKKGKVTKIHKGFKDGDIDKFEKEIIALLKSK